MLIFSVSEARKHWAQIMEWVSKGQHIYISKRGKIVAVIVPASEIPSLLPMEDKDREDY